MRYVSLLALLAYLGVLTFLLLSPDPFQIVGAHNERTWREFYFGYLDPVGHFLLFTPLGLLGCAGDLPCRRTWRLGFLALYALAGEGLQYFVPPRTVSWSDLLQNLAGLAAGAAVWWSLRAVRRQPAGERRASAP